MAAPLEKAADAPRYRAGSEPRLPERLMTDVGSALAGEDVLLLPERALFWPRAATLVAADFHWGKAATFRAAGIPIPDRHHRRRPARLDGALLRTCARRLVVLGDLFHAEAGRIATRTLAELRRWRERRPELEILLVRGNHDRHAGDPPDDLRINCLNAPAFVPPFVLRHEPAVSADGYTLAGHLHPGLVLAARAGGSISPASGSRRARRCCPRSAASRASGRCAPSRATGSSSSRMEKCWPSARPRWC